MSKDAKDAGEAAPKKKGKGRKVLMIVGLVAVLGGGGAAAAFKGGLLGNHSAAEENRPQLVLREGVSATEAARFYSPTGDSHPNPSEFQATYYPLEDNFTSNLRGAGFVQAGIGVSTYYDERVVDNVKKHEMAVRSAILLTLSEQDPNILSTPQGKEGLKSQLRKAVNDVLKKKEGFGGIDDVYFTSLVIQ